MSRSPEEVEGEAADKPHFEVRIKEAAGTGAFKTFEINIPTLL